ncbi:putative baseplate assembly protein [Catenulispora yoronensis]|uniref:putative baseplate assembly protein n=1 Tax=Catenulispora yoronensis TaxID=450799 RepID=UPI0031D6D35D
MTPEPVFNPPGRPALAYRAGDHASFRASMLARLASRPELDPLTTRDPDDPAIALLDCWAVVADILTFYQERIANEGYLRCATEAGSVTRLGRLVGHRPRPALAADTYLAYTLDPGADTVIPAGSSAKSQAADGRLPQTFETGEDLTAREEWNTLAVRTTDPPNITAYGVETLPALDVDGTTANLRKGDRLLFAFAPSGTAPTVPAYRARTVDSAAVDFTAGRTSVTLAPVQDPLDAYATARQALLNALIAAAGAVVATTDPTAEQITADLLQPLIDFLGGTPAPPPIETLYKVSPLLSALAETIALAARDAGCPLARWLDTGLGPVRTTGAALITVAAGITRDVDPEMARLRALATVMVCGDSSPGAGFVRIRDFHCPDPDRGAALAALTPILPALRRPPSRPPLSARFLDTPVAQLFQPDSDTHPRLLTAADRRLGQVYEAWRNVRVTDPPPLAGLSVLRLKAAIGEATVSDTNPWPGGTGSGNGVYEIKLDAVYSAVVPGQPILIGTAEGGNTLVLFPDHVAQDTWKVPNPDPTKTAPLATVPVTALYFDKPLPASLASKDSPKGPLQTGAGVWTQPEPLTPLGAAVTDDVGGDAIDLARCYDGLKPGRWVLITGERTDVPHTSGVQGAELAMVAGVSQRVDRLVDGEALPQPGQGPQTRLLLAGALAYTYRRPTVTVHGNVVAASQGETRTDILGSGDAGQGGQAFALHLVTDQTPLTWTAADTPLGAGSTLTVRVGGVAWHPSDALALSTPTGHDYVLASDPGDPALGQPGGETVAFGDGVHGARLPTGSQNVTATYRVGAGSVGNTDAGLINQLGSRPLGVKAVTNPLPAQGGTDADGPEDARAVIPLRLRALDRLVSVQDYEDFTRARAGIAKASAAKLFDGAREVVHVTFGTVGDIPAGPLSGLFTALEQALADFGDPAIPVRVAEREQRLIIMDAGVKVLPDYSWDLVEPAVRAALNAEFGYLARQLGQPAYQSEAIAAIQRVEGVDYVDLAVFDDVPGDVTPLQLLQLADNLSQAKTFLPAVAAHYEHLEYPTFYSDTLTSFAQRFGLTLDELAALNPQLTTISPDPETLLTVYRGIRPAQIAVLPADVPEALTLRRIP